MFQEYGMPENDIEPGLCPFQNLVVEYWQVANDFRCYPSLDIYTILYTPVFIHLNQSNLFFVKECVSTLHIQFFVFWGNNVFSKFNYT